MNYYEKAIDVLFSISQGDAKRLLCEIAKRNPKAVYDADKRLIDDGLEKQIIRKIRAGSKKIECIKTFRDATGAGLSEAEDYIAPLYERYARGN